MPQKPYIKQTGVDLINTKELQNEPAQQQNENSVTLFGTSIAITH